MVVIRIISQKGSFSAGGRAPRSSTPPPPLRDAGKEVVQIQVRRIDQDPAFGYMEQFKVPARIVDDAGAVQDGQQTEYGLVGCILDDRLQPLCICV